ncbi:hypothetical protein CsSME_00015052 [Camellia sinensis var. sinensis]
MIDFTIDWNADFFRDEGDYSIFIQTYLMRPLASARWVERERPAEPAGGAEAPRATQARDRSGSRERRRVEWPELPTTMTCRGQGGETYQIPIAPLPANHELVGVRGLTSASIEYTGQALELTASVMGMLQRSMDLLSIYSIPAPFQIPTIGGALAGLSVPPRAAGGVRRGMTIHSRGRHRRTRTEGSSQEPTLDDNDESDAEADSSQGEGGDGSDLDTGSRADGDDPGPSSRKRTRRDSRT